MTPTNTDCISAEIDARAVAVGVGSARGVSRSGHLETLSQEFGRPDLGGGLLRFATSLPLTSAEVNHEQPRRAPSDHHAAIWPGAGSNRYRYCPCSRTRHTDSRLTNRPASASVLTGVPRDAGPSRYVGARHRRTSGRPHLRRILARCPAPLSDRRIRVGAQRRHGRRTLSSTFPPGGHDSAGYCGRPTRTPRGGGPLEHSWWPAGQARGLSRRRVLRPVQAARAGHHLRLLGPRPLRHSTAWGPAWRSPGGAGAFQTNAWSSGVEAARVRVVRSRSRGCLRDTRLTRLARALDGGGAMKRRTKRCPSCPFGPDITLKGCEELAGCDRDQLICHEEDLLHGRQDISCRGAWEAVRRWERATKTREVPS